MHKNLKITILLFIGLLMPLFAITQKLSSEDSLQIVPQALELNQIPDFGKRTRKLINDIQEIIDKNESLDEIMPGVDGVVEILDKKETFLRDSLMVYRLDRLQKEDRELSLLGQRVNKWKESIEGVWDEISEKDSIANSIIDIWQITLDTLNLEDDHIAKKSDTIKVGDIRTEVIKYVDDLKASKESLSDFSRSVQDIQTQITITENQIGNISDIIAQKEDALVNELWVPESPAIWEVRKDTANLSAESNLFEFVKSNWSIITVFHKNHPDLPNNALMFLIVIFGTILFIKARAKNLYTNYQEELASAEIVLQNPLIATLIIGWFFTLFFADTPKELNDLISLVMLAPVIFILRKIEPNWTWRKVLIFAITYILFLIIREIDYNVLSRRLFLLVLDIIAVVSISYLLKHQELYQRINKYWHGSVPLLGYFFRIICMIAIVGNLFGTVQLAQLLTYVTLGTIITLHVLSACIVLTRNFTFLLLMGPLMKYSNILQEDGKIVLNKMDSFFNLLGSVSMVFIILGFFNARSEALEFVMAMINYELTVGEISLSLGNIIAFVLTIQISMWLSSFIRFVLEKEVFPRAHMKQGLPNTISLMIKFAFVLFGILFAFSAAGIQIDKLAIVMGALGVGIGFGLQNIINNFVSGIILALERPITIGDIIDIPGANGTVKDIGIRASTVRQWDGSDVIVPNGELISNKLTNWTFYDRLRRVKIDVRVPFDTNIEKVSKLLLDTAKEIPEVMKKPAPYLNFAGIGTSAMEITLYCWIKDSGSIFSLGTAIRKAVYKALSDAGYDIPVPKQDLSISTDKEPRSSS